MDSKQASSLKKNIERFQKESSLIKLRFRLVRVNNVFICTVLM